MTTDPDNVSTDVKEPPPTVRVDIAVTADGRDFTHTSNITTPLPVDPYNAARSLLHRAVSAVQGDIGRVLHAYTRGWTGGGRGVEPVHVVVTVTVAGEKWPLELDGTTDGNPAHTGAAMLATAADTLAERLENQRFRAKQARVALNAATSAGPWANPGQAGEAAVGPVGVRIDRSLIGIGYTVVICASGPAALLRGAAGVPVGSRLTRRAAVRLADHVGRVIGATPTWSRTA